MFEKLYSKINLDLVERSYPIYIGENLLNQSKIIEEEINKRQVVIVTNEVVSPLYSDLLTSICDSNNSEYLLIVLPDGEKNKSISVLVTIFDQMIEKNINRDAVLIALGGGVIGDMAGFAASCYQRGIDFLQIPTTLLSQVDSSVGGKTAVNHKFGKNMIGAFYQPKKVIIDIKTLDTLPDREFVSGIAEIIKYGCIKDRNFFDWIELNIQELLARSPSKLADAIKRSCEIKAEVVALDETESGYRAILNFGHTFGHAIETGLGYGEWLHGEAVGCGMVMASKLSSAVCLLNSTDEQRIKNLINTAGLPVSWPNWDPKRYFGLMSNDKKVKNKLIRYVLLKKIGESTLIPVDDDVVSSALFGVKH
ncbi:MAG: 3-dehydroquinate synthase [Betaproteobacteria bacterium TMED156]|nr:MAG: 3-dehydroquinate synthase [Betaproteobacteria bacterium TMED156]